jgi:hypothetical protein
VPPPASPLSSLSPKPIRACDPRLALRRRGGWSRLEVAAFKVAYGSHTDEELAARFGRSLAKVRALAADQRLAKDKAFLARLLGPRATRMPRWDEREVRLLRRHYATRPNLELARELERTVTSIVSKARLLGLRKSEQRLREMGRTNVSVRYAERAAVDLR